MGFRRTGHSFAPRRRRATVLQTVLICCERPESLSRILASACNLFRWTLSGGTSVSASELIYLLYKKKWFNMRSKLKINDVAVESKINIKMLKLQIDIKLKGHFHMKRIKIKMIIQCIMFFKIRIFTWKTFFVKQNKFI